ncbi:MFS transporter [Actinoplanes sp. LDG1-06]|uniref:MFS transporter n=1 Tax=Paractinoplanes ovalisporus TaxID=2810368 RepID=A0ABS2AR72_9ACTN|nr:MFS transporter [Actinoplanes ovalisporus]MBM2622362.1 MFS transporter [Actinoplanes ovalisporus]
MLIPASALFWGLQFAFLNPALALLLATVFDASAGEIGWALAIYNAGGFVASLLVPAYADRAGDYVRPMLACGVLTLGLAGVLAVTTALPVAVVALVLLGGPAGVGSSLLFAHLKHTGAAPGDVVRTRAFVSFAWVAGPPLATLVIAGFGPRAILAAIAAVAVLNVATTAAMHRAVVVRDRGPAVEDERMPRGRVVAVVVVFIALQATNSATVSVMSLFVTDRLGLAVAWAGIALGVAAALEIPALLLIGKLTGRISGPVLLLSGCAAGVVYYAAMAVVRGPVLLLGLQLLNAWFFATVAGVGLTLFQQIIPRPGLAAGLYTNTRRLGAIAAGPLIGLGAATRLGYGAVFAAAAVITVAALIALRLTPFARPPVSGEGDRISGDLAATTKQHS